MYFYTFILFALIFELIFLLIEQIGYVFKFIGEENGRLYEFKELFIENYDTLLLILLFISFLVLFIDSLEY